MRKKFLIFNTIGIMIGHDSVRANTDSAKKLGWTVVSYDEARAAPAMKKALEQLIHLHMCEQEGIACGMPTVEQWNEALDAAQEAVDLAKEEE